MSSEQPIPTDEPEVLPYAARAIGVRRRFFTRGCLLLLVLLLGLGALAALMYQGLEYGTATFSCLHCGATREQKILTLFGLDLRSQDQVQEGPISKLIQKSDGWKCVHLWEFADYSSNRVGASGRGLRRYICVCMVEPYPELPGILQQHADEDPNFVATLKASIQSGDRTDPVIQGLLEEIMDNYKP